MRFGWTGSNPNLVREIAVTLVDVTVIGDVFPDDHELSGYRDRLWLSSSSIIAITKGDGRAHVLLPGGAIRVDETAERLASRLGWARDVGVGPEAET